MERREWEIKTWRERLRGRERDLGRETRRRVRDGETERETGRKTLEEGEMERLGGRD